MKMEGDFVNTVISILLLEGIGRQLDPGLDLFASALPILRQLGGQMATRELPSSNLGALLKVRAKFQFWKVNIIDFCLTRFGCGWRPVPLFHLPLSTLMIWSNTTCAF